MVSVRAFNTSRSIRRIAGALAIGGCVALLLRLSLAALHGRGLEPYVTFWGIETTPVQALTGTGVGLLALASAELLRRRRGDRGPGRRRGRKARGPLRPPSAQSRFPF
jgi:hypothetical protein